MDIITFYNEILFDMYQWLFGWLVVDVRYIPKHKVLIIGGDMNIQIDENNKFCWHNSSNRNGEYIKDFSLEKRLVRLDTKFQKREGKLWINTYPNNAETLQDYILISKKWTSGVWTVRCIPLLKEYPTITEPSQQRYIWVYVEIRNKPTKSLVMTGPHLPIEVLAINIW